MVVYINWDSCGESSNLKKATHKHVTLNGVFLFLVGVGGNLSMLCTNQHQTHGSENISPGSKFLYLPLSLDLFSRNRLLIYSIVGSIFDLLDRETSSAFADCGI